MDPQPALPPSRPGPTGAGAAAGSRPLEPVGEELRALLATAAGYVARVVDDLPDAPASDFDGLAALLADPRLRQPPPEHGRPVEELLEVIDRAAAVGFNAGGPGYLAFVPGSGLVSAAVADLIADVLNRFTGLAFPAPGLVAMEDSVLRWLIDLFGLPPGAYGILTSGASLATLSALITARVACLPENFLDGTLYITGHAHQAVRKAARLAGFPATAIRVVAVDREFRMDVAALRSAIGSDRAAGRTPFCVVATAGTTNTGTIDPLVDIADVAAVEGLLLHVDAAYGGAFQLTDRGRRRLHGISRADSLVLDPHKGLFLPFGTGALLVRDGEQLRRAHSGEEGHYLQDIGDTGLPNFGDYSPELTRDYRGLRLWLPLHLHGVAAFRAALDEKLDLTELTHAELAADPHLVVLAAPDLTAVAFRCRLPAGRTPDEDAATVELVRRVNAERRVMLSSTRIDGRYAARIMVLNHRTDRARVGEAIEAVRRHAAALCTTA